MLVGLGLTLAAGAQTRRDVTVKAHKYAFAVDGKEPARIQVQKDDLVHVTFSTDDIPHSMEIDGYKIAKRAERGKPAVFDFRADQVGTFTFFCKLEIDDGCKKMRGELIVVAKDR